LKTCLYAVTMAMALAGPGSLAHAADSAAQGAGSQSVAPQSPDPKADAAREAAKETGHGEGIDPVGTGDQALDKEEIQTGGPGKPATETEPKPSRPTGAATGESSAAPALQTRQVRVADLQSYRVVNEAGEPLGSNQGIARAGGQDFAVVRLRGDGAGTPDQVALPLDRMIVGADRTLVIPALTQGEMDKLAERDPSTLQPLQGDAEVSVGLAG